MRKINGVYILSPTDIKRIEAHTRALAKQAHYYGYIEAWFDSSTGKVNYYELTDNDYMVSSSDDDKCICCASCAPWD